MSSGVGQSLLLKRSGLIQEVLLQWFFVIFTRRGVAQRGSAPALGAGGRRFKSCRPDHYLFHQVFRPVKTSITWPFGHIMPVFGAGQFMPVFPYCHLISASPF